MQTGDEERLAAIRAHYYDLEEIVWLLALVDRLKAERDETQRLADAAFVALREAHTEAASLRARVAKLEAVADAARDLDEQCHGWAGEDRVSAPKPLFKKLRSALSTLDNEGADRGA